ncbi:MAG: hypothetical protein KR126chlam4_00791 [Candidatus Anoxychlamydiales bacterium]|nr:hypothetical protein [Candidatus Anoxychlamydiales bacterium]NGX40960.1 hypothetical protein [Candidatus Anoxychlamydiales bacterium]
MSLEPIIPINSIDEINNSSNPLEFQKIIVDKKLFNSFEDESDNPKPLDIVDIDKKNIRMSKAGLRKAKAEVQNKANFKTESLDILAKYKNNPEGISPLHYAVKMKDINAIKILLENGANVNDFYALQASLSSPDILEFLLNYGADVNITCRKATLLHSAAYYENLEAIHILINYGIDLEAVNSSGNSALIDACRQGKEKSILLLLEMGADVNKEGQQGWKPLQLYLNKTHQNMTIIKEFAKRGADFNKIDPYGRTALQLAVIYNQIDLIQYLIEEQHVDVNFLPHKTDRTAFMVAIEFGRQLEIMKLLFKNGADLNIKNEQGETALTIARKRYGDKEEIILWLIANGARE